MIRIPSMIVAVGALAATAHAQIPEQPGMDKIASLLERLGVELDDAASKVLEAGTPSSASKARKSALESARTRADDAIATIDEILDAIPPCTSCGSSSCDKGMTGGSGGQPSGSKPRPGQEKKAGATPGDNKPQPPERAANQSGPPPLQRERELVDLGLDPGQWGDLPAQVREMFRNPDTDRLPPRYRHWIEDYYRRVRQQDSR